MKGNQVLADKLIFKRKSLFKDSAFVNRIAKVCSFKLAYSFCWDRWGTFPYCKG